MDGTATPGRAPGLGALSFGIGIILSVWSFNFIATKIALRHLSAMAVADFRILLAAIALLPVYFLCQRFPAFANAAKFRSRVFTSRALGAFAYLGLFGVVVNQVGLTLGLRYTSVTHAAVIVGMDPVYALLLAVLLRMERFSRRKAAGMVVALIGVTILALQGTGSSAISASLFGDAIVFVSAIGFALYIVLGKRVAGQYDALTMTTFNQLAAAILILPLGIRDCLHIGPAAQWLAVPLQTWLAIAFMALLGSSLAYVLFYWLLRYMEASRLTTFLYLQPVLATLLAVWLLGEHLSWLQVLGGVIAMGGVYWVESEGAHSPSEAVA